MLTCCFIIVPKWKDPNSSSTKEIHKLWYTPMMEYPVSVNMIEPQLRRNTDDSQNTCAVKGQEYESMYVKFQKKQN